jgi:hypothetical protein
LAFSAAIVRLNFENPAKPRLKIIWASPVGELYEDVEPDGGFVRAAAFDQLLALYREALRDIEQSDPRFDTSR